MKKKSKTSKLIGKNVRVVVTIGNVSIKYRGILKKLGDWVSIETKEGIKLINKSNCVLIEKAKP
jgi:hypothetical protein